MSTGTITSGIGHGALIVWLLLGDWLFSPPEPEELTAVSTSMVTEAEFAAMQAAVAATPDPAEVPAVEAPPEPEVVEPPPEPEVIEPPPEPEVVEPPPEPEVVEPVPEPVEPGPTAPDVDPSDLPSAVELQPLQSDAPSIRPRPRPAQVVSTDPTVSEEEQTAEAEPVAATAPAEEPDPVEPVEPTDPVVEQDTGDVLETEATEATDQPLGLTSSPRPPRRPEAPTETEVAEAPAEEPAEEPATDTAATEDPMTDILNEVVDEGAATDGGNTAPQGPPMTAGEVDGLRVSMKKCWNLGTQSTEALRVKVTVYVRLDPDGKPDADSIEMTGFEDGSAAAAEVAYSAARRAIIRCGKDGYQLPPEKYEEWKELRITFNPDQMRAR